MPDVITAPPAGQRTGTHLGSLTPWTAAAVLLMVPAQFAWLATLPVTLVLIGSFTDRRLRRARVAATALALAYAVPYVVWKTRTAPAPSLSKDLAPGVAVGIMAAAALVIVAFLLDRREAGPEHHS